MAVYRLVAGRPAALAAAAIVLVLALSWAHLHIRAEYKVTDYLPVDSDVREAESLANSIFGGRSMLLVAVPKAKAGSPLSPENRARLDTVETALGKVFDRGRISSVNRLAAGLDDPAALARLAGDLEAGEERSALQSRSGDSMLVTVRIPSNQAIIETGRQIEAVRSEFALIEGGEEIVVTGFDVLMAEEFISLIDQLRGSLIIEIVLGMVIIGIAARSALLAVAALTPNLLPILFVEWVIYLRGGAVNMSDVIALTIGFGIAVGNAVHIINFYRAERARGAAPQQAVKDAIAGAGPAVAASMIIICVSSLVTQASSLPMVPVLGILIISTLVMALAANLVILPANILVLEKWLETRRPLSGRPKGQTK
jgi:hypothetical protein